ncbi:MAG: hypothetical protein OQK73_13150 [Gammaproteobacteria bacterium]|nr:hypothetical protein [Gammaproteobacteria bacterium]
MTVLSKYNLLRLCAVSSLLFSAHVSWAVEADFSGYLSAEYRYFSNNAIDSRQADNNYSLAYEPEFYFDWPEHKQSLTFKVFARYDQHDHERSHIDIRELLWLKVTNDWELRTGISKVFWGVTESQHLVDIINQSDAVENLDLEDKLGQPMVNLKLIKDIGNFDFFILPYFRERTFAGVEGRPRTQPYVDTDNPVYQSNNAERHIDYALRWSRNINEWDVGLSHFAGTARTPRLVAGTNASGSTVLIPHYDLIKQSGLDVQGTFDAWLWKLELIRQTGIQPDYYASTFGFEYTFFGLFDTPADLGLILEHLYDDRSDLAPTPYQDDLMLGLRYILNDEQSTELLLGQILDRHSGAASYNLEASRRFGDNLKLNIEARFFSNLPVTDPTYVYREDDYILAELVYYY